MSTDPLVLMVEVDRATQRVLDAVAGLDDSVVTTRSLLPGWSRGQVLTHLARNADSYVRLLTWASTGEHTPQYRDMAERDLEIEAGAGRPIAEQLGDLRDSAARLADAVAAMPTGAWSAVVRTISGRDRPAAQLIWGRLRELEVHHVDLNIGYTFTDWTDAFAQRLLREVATDLARHHGAEPMTLRAPELGHDLAIGETAGAPVITGPAHTLAAWLTGRSDGKDLTVTPDGRPLPLTPNWM
ncbi:maleylpyruvate isomerase family mycothiol-dependent enzyme [Rhizomonospora bruguierae]|uniref:maleylpyruvate isomerase family mycothiol-dependent enzyme n=1 Tax=Rhizomonospora bruguierae TaxID=1581705 RepID=UPI001BCD6C05|nr:maleylpyruvate isomerase family mycothiol-dependent enzyme [Micromonospora sp. NBRC 107566]